MFDYLPKTPRMTGSYRELGATRHTLLPAGDDPAVLYKETGSSDQSVFLTPAQNGYTCAIGCLRVGIVPLSS